jgi:hypothetical protein
MSEKLSGLPPGFHSPLAEEPAALIAHGGVCEGGGLGHD